MKAPRRRRVGASLRRGGTIVRLCAAALLWPSGCDCFFDDHRSTGSGCGGVGEYDAGPAPDYGPPRSRYDDCSEVDCARECAAGDMFGRCRWSAGVLECQCVAGTSSGCDPSDCLERCASLGYARWACDGVGCRCYNTAPGAADADADADDEDIAEETDGGEDVGPCGPAGCPNDPGPGPVGLPCSAPEDCAPGLDCQTERVDIVADRTYVAWAGGYCLHRAYGDAGCAPATSWPCPPGACCLLVGTSVVDGDLFGCFDSCAPASAAGVPWTTRCDCREGYRCDLVARACLPGCSSDAECCEIWRDGVGGPADGERQTEELESLPSEECADVCDSCTSACRRDGCPGGACRVGDPCRHDAHCPPGGRCAVALPDGAGPIVGGMCVVDRCDLAGRSCPVGSSCGLWADPYRRPAPAPTCLVPCAAGELPGAPGNPCRDSGTAGLPDEGDHACVPVEPAFWSDGTIADGVCLPGNFPGGAIPLGGPCADRSDCESARGLGVCEDLDGSTVPVCAAACNDRLAGAALCGGAGADGTATGACLAGRCRVACDGPDRILTSNGCADRFSACYPLWRFDGTARSAVGVVPPLGLCLAPCADDAECAVRWGAGSMCNPLSRVCSPG